MKTHDSEQSKRDEQYLRCLFQSKNALQVQAFVSWCFAKPTDVVVKRCIELQGLGSVELAGAITSANQIIRETVLAIAEF